MHDVCILVTGGCGFIGSHFIDCVLKSTTNWKVWNIDALTYAGDKANLFQWAGDRRYRFLHGNIATFDLETLASIKPDWIVNFAAETHVDNSISAPAPFITSNYVGTYRMLELSRLCGARMLQISTDEVYGDLEDGGYATERYPLEPSSPYSATKAAGDMLLLAYNRTYEVPYILTRSSNNSVSYTHLTLPTKRIV